MTDAATRFDVAMGLALDAGPAHGGCPDADELVAWHEARLDGARATAVEAHVAHCAHCYTAWRALIDLTTDQVPARRWRLLLPIAAAAAVTALVMGAWLLRPHDALPDYSVQVREMATTRAAGPWTAASAVTVRAGAPLQMLLTPAERPDGRVEAAVYLDGARLQTVRTDVGAGGGVRVNVPTGAGTELAAGTHTVRVVVARRGRLPATRATGDAPARDTGVYPVTVTVVP